MDKQSKYQVSESLTDCTEQIQEIVHDVYHRTILTELQYQKKLLYNQLKSFNFEQAQALDIASTSKATSPFLPITPPKSKVTSLYTAAKRDIANVLHIDSDTFNAQHDISKLLEHAIRSEIESQFDSNTLLFDAPSISEEDAFDDNQITDQMLSERILELIHDADAVNEWHDVKCWVVNNGKWTDMSSDKVDLTLYQIQKHEPNDDSKNDQKHDHNVQFLVFGEDDNALSFQPVDGGITDIEHPENNKSAVIWEACDWVHSRNHFTFCAKFATESECTLFTRYLHDALASNHSMNGINGMSQCNGYSDDSKEDIFGLNGHHHGNHGDHIDDDKSTKKKRRRRKKKKKGDFPFSTLSNGSTANIAVLSDSKSGTSGLSENRKIQELEAEVQRLLNALHVAEANGFNKVNGSNTLQQRNEALESKMVQMTKDMEALREKLKKSRTASDNNKNLWSKKKKNFETELKAIKSKNETLKAQNDSIKVMTQRFEAGEERRRAMETELVILKEEHTTLVREYEAAMEKMRGMSTDEQVEQLIKDFKAKVVDLSEENENTKEMNQQITVRNEGLKRENGELQKTIKGMTADITQMEDQKSQYRQQLEVVKKENKELSVQIEDQKKRLKMITDKLNAFEGRPKTVERAKTVPVERVASFGNGGTWTWPTSEKQEHQMNGRSKSSRGIGGNRGFDNERMVRTSSISKDRRDETLPVTPSSVSTNSPATTGPKLVNSWCVFLNYMRLLMSGKWE